VRDDLLNVLLPAQGTVPPLLITESRKVVRKRRPLGARQCPQVVVLGFRHIVLIRRVVLSFDIDLP
jgi:hypothetical protein